MAAASTAFAAVTGSAALVSKGNASRLSSGNAFRTTSVVQFAPLTSKRSNRIVAARASLPEDSKTGGRDAVVSILAVGAALGLSVSVVEGAFANPFDFAKNKATTTLKSAKDATPDLPSAPSPGGAVEDAKIKAGNIAQSIPTAPSADGAVDDAKKNAGNIAEDIKGKADGIFGAGKPGPLSKSNNAVASTNGGTGSAIGDAKKRVSEFGKNPIPDNINEATKKTENAIAQAPKSNDTRVEKATDKVGSITSDLQTQGKDAIAEGKGFLGGSTQGNLPSFPNLIPKLPETPDIPTPDTGKGLQDLKSGVESKVEGAKSAAGSVIPR